MSYPTTPQNEYLKTSASLNEKNMLLEPQVDKADYDDETDEYEHGGKPLPDQTKE